MTPSAFEAAVARIALQPLVFAERPRRSALLAASFPGGLRPLRVRIHRNAPVEHLLGPLARFLAFSGYALETLLGDYDDALSYAGASLEAACDLDLIYLDLGRYAPQLPGPDLAAWLGSRVAALRQLSASPILVAGAEPPLGPAFDADLEQQLKVTAAARVVPRLGLAASLGTQYWDARLEGIGATRLSDAAYMALARDLGLAWIPASQGPRLKALALDLDHTLYRGVLGEDGPEGLELGSRHVALHQRILELKQEGLLLALVSRNEPEDVTALFKQRPDFPLRREDFSAFEVGWGSKAEALTRAADKLRIAPDAFLFVDDNLGELAAVAAAHPGVGLLHASDPEATLRGLRWYPGLQRWSESGADQVRAADLQVQAVRASLAAEGLDDDTYLASLGVRLVFSYNQKAQETRLAELSGKTNQFNLSLRRLSEAELAARGRDPRCATVAAALSDRLSDSGSILSLCARLDGNTLLVEDLCISCRALGRRLEFPLVVEGINGILGHLPAAFVAFDHALGPRNAPAREWLAGFTGEALAHAGQVRMPWDLAQRAAAIRALPLDIQWN